MGRLSNDRLNVPQTAVEGGLTRVISFPGVPPIDEVRGGRVGSGVSTMIRRALAAAPLIMFNWRRTSFRRRCRIVSAIAATSVVSTCKRFNDSATLAIADMPGRRRERKPMPPHLMQRWGRDPKISWPHPSHSKSGRTTAIAIVPMGSFVSGSIVPPISCRPSPGPPHRSHKLAAAFVDGLRLAPQCPLHPPQQGGSFAFVVASNVRLRQGVGQSPVPLRSIRIAVDGNLQGHVHVLQLVHAIPAMS